MLPKCWHGVWDHLAHHNMEPKYETNATNQKCNLNMQPMQTHPSMQPMLGGRASGTNAGRRTGGTNAGGRAGGRGRILERVKLSSIVATLMVIL